MVIRVSTYIVKITYYRAGGTTGGVLSSGCCGLGISTTDGLSPVRDLAWCANRPTADPMPAPPSITSANVSFSEGMGYVSEVRTVEGRRTFPKQSWCYDGQKDPTDSRVVICSYGRGLDGVCVNNSASGNNSKATYVVCCYQPSLPNLLAIRP